MEAGRIWVSKNNKMIHFKTETNTSFSQQGYHHTMRRQTDSGNATGPQELSNLFLYNNDENMLILTENVC